MKKIILAVDGSTFSIQAARFLARLPHPEPLEIIVLSVAEVPPHTRDYPTGPWLQESLERARAAAEDRFAELEEIFQGANVTVTNELREGHLGETIVKFAREQNADFVVLGARGHSRVSRILLGSTSDYVATHAPCSVLVVRPRGPNRDDAPLRIAVAYEAADSADDAIKEFGQFLWGPEVEVDVVTVASYLFGFFTEFENDPLSVKRLTERLQTVADKVKDIAPEVKPRLIESEHIGEGLVNYVADRQTDLIVLGETPRGTVGRVLLGSVSRYVLRHAPCSVWIARNRAYAPDSNRKVWKCAHKPLPWVECANWRAFEQVPHRSPGLSAIDMSQSRPAGEAQCLTGTLHPGIYGEFRLQSKAGSGVQRDFRHGNC